MLESVISPCCAEKNPWDMIILAIILSTIGIFCGHYLSPLLGVPASMLSLAITVMALAPLIHRLIVMDERVEEDADHSSVFGFVTRHIDIIMVYSFIFIGLLCSFCFWYVFLPPSTTDFPSAEGIFGEQELSVGAVRQKIATSVPTAKAISTNAILENKMSNYVANNLWVMALCFASSLLFGAGALWITTWNASTIGVAVGASINSATAAGADKVAAFATGFPTLTLGMAAWAIPEILAYLLAGIGGGILAAAVIRHNFKDEKFIIAAFDGLVFLLLGFVLVIVAALVETYLPTMV